MKNVIIFIAMSLFIIACNDSANDNDNQIQENKQAVIEQQCPSMPAVVPMHAGKITQKFADTDNIESVRVLPGTNGASIAVASKAKVVYRTTLNGNKLNTSRILALTGVGDDDELTNSAAINSTDFVVTHTMIRRSGSSATAPIVDCVGEIIIYDGVNCKTHRIAVGPMPDSVAVSSDRRYIITADELDSVDSWGKCPVNASDTQGISIIDISNGYENARVVKQIKFTKNLIGPREPEYIAIASDNDSVLVTLQDSHEVAAFSLSQILAMTDDKLDESVTTIKQLPANPAGDNPWPDGVTSFNANGNIYFAIAGEWNDSIIIVDKTGETVANISITEKEVPTNYPCIDDNESPRYSPDSITSFTKDDKVYVAATLRFAGAVIIYDVTNPEAPVFERIESVGEEDGSGCSKDGSVVYPEGIQAGEGYIWTANEGESSVSVLKY